MKSNAEPWGASAEETTTPDLRVSELNSRTRLTERVATLEAEAASAQRGNTTVSLSCMQHAWLLLVCELVSAGGTAGLDLQGVNSPSLGVDRTSEG